MLSLWLPVVVPVLIQEGAKLARRYLKEQRRARERRQDEELKKLHERIERLETAARWAP